MTKNTIKEQVMKPIIDAGFDVFFVGGCVRDELLGKEPNDFDLATNATPNDLYKVFTKFSEINSEGFGVTMPIIDGEAIEIATFRKDGSYSDGRHPDSVEFSNIAEDAARRDFTINALYEDIDGNIIDPTTFGKKSIENKTIMFVGEATDRVTEDPLRLLRAFRFASTLGFTLDPKAKAAFATVDENTLASVSKERINKELSKAFSGKFFSINLFIECSIPKMIGIEKIFLDMANEPQNPDYHQEGDCLRHTMLVVDKMVEKDHDHLDVIAAMFHDAGKPASVVKNGGRDPVKGFGRMQGHAELSAEIVGNWMYEYKFTNKEIARVQWVVGKHMSAHDLYKMKSKFNVMRITSHPNFDRLVKLANSDCEGSVSAITEDSMPLFFATDMWKKVGGKKMPAMLITGDDLIAAGLKPGPIFKKALDILHKMQVNRDETSKDEMLKHVKGIVNCVQ